MSGPEQPSARAGHSPDGPAQPVHGQPPAAPPYPAPAPYGSWPGQPYPGQPYPGSPPVAAGWPTAGFAPGPPQPPVALPVVPREYHEFFRAPRFRWWRPLLSLLMFGGLWLLAMFVLPAIALGIDVASGRVDLDDLGGDPAQVMNAVMTPFMFTANNLALALAIPFAGLTAWTVYGQRPKWMSSITGGFRWSLLWRFSVVALPVFLLSLGVEALLSGPPELRWNADSVFLIAVVLLTTPFQAAGEEYGVRGLVARSLGSWFGSRRVGLAVAAVLSSLLFMSLHAADNIWLNIYYFAVGMICSVLAWRTGGLEAPVALHIWNNMVSEVTIPFGGLEGIFDRGPDAVGPEILLQLIFTVAVMIGMLWIARRRQLPRTAAPGAPPGEASADRGVLWNSPHDRLTKA